MDGEGTRKWRFSRVRENLTFGMTRYDMFFNMRWQCGACGEEMASECIDLHYCADAAHSKHPHLHARCPVCGYAWIEALSIREVVANPPKNLASQVIFVPDTYRPGLLSRLWARLRRT